MSPFYAFLTSDAADAAAAAAAQPSVLGPALVCHFPTAEGKTRPASRVASQPATLFLFLPLPLLLLCFFFSSYHLVTQTRRRITWLMGNKTDAAGG